MLSPEQLRETGKIIGLAVLAACLYGIAHDMVTARICLPYFTEFHPDLGAPPTPNGQALTWGIVATWWVGLPLGAVLAWAAQWGSQRRLSARQLVKPVLVLLVGMGVGAAITGWIGYHVGEPLASMAFPPSLERSIEFRKSFAAVLFTHNASYFLGILGGVILAVWTRRQCAG